MRWLILRIGRNSHQVRTIEGGKEPEKSRLKEKGNETYTPSGNKSRYPCMHHSIRNVIY